MLYKFDEQWNGTVIAEAREEDMVPYLNLRFPASDVPKQARELYFSNPYRIIPDVNYKPATLIPIVNPITYNFTDLSDCILRSVPNVHIEYLNNMNVGASMSTPIIKNNKLWGLISCHHKTSKFLSFEMRSAFELLSNIIAAQLAAKESEGILIYSSKLKDIYSNIITQMYAAEDFRTGLFDTNPNLLDLLNLSGAVVVLDGEYMDKGKTPDLNDIKDLIRWLQRQNIDKVFATSELPRLFQKFENNKDIASGLIAIPISAKRGDFILGFRGEVIKTVQWGGDPNQAINFEPDGKNYHPRNSFAVWKETVRHTSMPWQQHEIEIAETLRTATLELILAERY
jgi:chemotaxis family two-component system sensor kinase Cph1